MIGPRDSKELDMFAAIKLILAIGIASGTMIASIVETPYPRFASCFWVAFLLGALMAERTRARRGLRVRYLSSRARVSANSLT
jgi:hypothetical protein